MEEAGWRSGELECLESGNGAYGKWDGAYRIFEVKRVQESDMKKYVVIADPGTGHLTKKVFGPFDSAEAGLQFSRAKVKEISAGKDFIDGTEGEWNSAGGKNMDEKFLPWHISAGMDSCQFLVLELTDPGIGAY